MKNVTQWVAGMLWVGALTSAAAPADAFALASWTSGSGSFATCSDYYFNHISSCGSFAFSYDQQVKLVTTACATGAGCTSTSPTLPTDQIYFKGRKTVNPYTTCAPGANVIGLGTCGC
jgi:hypothetical protein